ncbi:MAG TPA: FUSC family protein [Acidobacteriaceae bacterium]
MGTTGLTRELRRVNWDAAEWHASLLCLPAIAIALIGALALGNRNAALVMAGSAQSVGFGAFQRPLWFRGGPMVIATLGMALSAAVGELAANRPWVLLFLVTFWAFCYGMSNAISSPASWVGQQCCIFLVVSSALPGTPYAAALRGAGVLSGGFLQFVCILLLWRFFAPARTTYSDPGIHTPGWQRRAVIENLTFRSSTFRYALLLALTGLVAQGIAQWLHFQNAYWIPMTALIIMKPDLLLTNARSIARLGGTFVGAGLATLIATTLRPDGIWLSLLIVVSMYVAYALQNVNYALYAVPLTAYIVFILAVARTPEASTAEHRVIATAIAGVVAMLLHALYVREELQRLARTLLPG